MTTKHNITIIGVDNFGQAIAQVLGD